MIVKTADELPLFMACNGSHVMPKTLPESIDDDPKARDEGNAAHWLAAAAFNGEFTIAELVDRKAPNGFNITLEMADHITDFLACLAPRENGAMMEVITSFANGQLWRVNSRADYIFYIPERRKLKVNDFKYGWRVVEPEMHWSLIAHAIGWSLQSGFWPDLIEFGIYQPRPHHRDGKFRTWTITGVELYNLYRTLDATMSNPTLEVRSNPLCIKCLAVASCPAAKLAGYNAIDASDKAHSEDISNADLAFELDTLARAKKALETRQDALTALAKHRVERGQVVPNYSLERQLTDRQFKDFVTPDFFRVLTGKDVEVRKMGTPAAAERAGVPKEVVAAFSVRRETGVKLVRVDANKKAKKLLGEKTQP